MINYTVQLSQSVFDVALMVYGAPEGAAWLVEDNDLQGWRVDPNQVLQVRDEVINQAMVDYFKEKKLTVATDEPFYNGRDFNDDFNEDFL